ncbi:MULTISPECIES: HlyD family type I secretion periplasmic adaptor subunit [Burkholderia]|uniref:HlyD family type I secretion periplasmic adaptor subunit n=1 Tax=Burkholderia TaxID=32008 RepID=UPI00075A9197|nr:MULTISPECIES: HlyD family type I secretion periplasmic adaptor subunit [Burkholderia]AOJ73432.1 hemolysin D [Burkholderia savannae]KVG50342.1 hemolysin D [Burkholderia sp. MSMB0265]KVG83404.1 hemolysin D [Burkholderia sp. MSMB2040]KVG97329.1 hemolysin D [Burkholderia sp. MSMB2042]KVG99927.1 hemolysin D [Burkholderia sp. MSMB2041]
MKFIHHLQAIGDLLSRYAAVIRESWAIRHELDGETRLAHELAFLPANLELVETPVHPLPLWTMRVIVALGILVVLVACFGRLDIVATAPGKLIPREQVKTIQPAITGVVRRILVRDGQRVAAGQLLMELDATQAAADSDKARLSKIEAALAAARARTLLDAQQHARAPVVAQVDGATEAQQHEAQHLTDGFYHEYRDKLSSAQAELMKREAGLGTTAQQIAKLTATAPLARRQADDYRSLAGDRYVATSDYLDKEQTALGQEHELAAQRSHAREMAAAVAQQRAEIASITSQFRRQQLDSLDKATQQLAQSRHDETKADTRQKLLNLTAPVAGTVQQLRVHTLGGVATAASPVMNIVPDDVIEVEANLENKDVGFVKAGQPAIVKIEAFPYTRYGFLTGTVESVSNDAVQDRKRGLTFVTRIRLPTNRIRTNDTWVNLTPGMAVTAEIKTGTRNVARYFLDSVMQTGQESLRER